MLGLGAGWLGSRPIAVSHDHRVELLLSLLVAYGTYLVADALHQSGIIATVVAGVVIGNRGRRLGLDAEAREALDLAWERIALILTAFAFVLVGLAISVADLAGAATAILWGVVAIVVGRIVVVYGLLGGVSRLLQDRTHLGDIPMGWLHVLFWAGLRGAVAVAMALALPTDFPERTLLQEITFGIVLFTLLVQGTTAEWVVARATRSRDPQPHGPPPEPRPSG